MPDIEDKLFLLDFVVDKVDLSILPYEANDQDESCVSFEFLNNEPVTLHQDEFQPKTKGCVKGGKSCLFPMSAEIEVWAMTDFQIMVTVSKIIKKDEFIPVGFTNICISQLFKEVARDLAEKGTGFPTSKSLKDSYRLMNIDGTCSGNVTVYLRLSCIGRTIVTQFKIGADSTFMFRGNDSTEEYHFSRKTSSNDSTSNKVEEEGRKGMPVQDRGRGLVQAHAQVLYTQSDVGQPTDETKASQEKAMKILSAVKSKCGEDLQFELMSTQSEMQPATFLKTNVNLMNLDTDSRLARCDVDKSDCPKNTTLGRMAQLNRLRQMCRTVGSLTRRTATSSKTQSPNELSAGQRQLLIERYRVDRFPKNLELIVSDELKKIGMMDKLNSMDALNKAISNRDQMVQEPFRLYRETVSRRRFASDDEDSDASSESLQEFMQSELRAKLTTHITARPQETRQTQYARRDIQPPPPVNTSRAAERKASIVSKSSTKNSFANTAAQSMPQSASRRKNRNSSESRRMISQSLYQPIASPRASRAKSGKDGPVMARDRSRASHGGGGSMVVTPKKRKKKAKK